MAAMTVTSHMLVPDLQAVLNFRPAAMMLLLHCMLLPDVGSMTIVHCLWHEVGMHILNTPSQTGIASVQSLLAARGASILCCLLYCAVAAFARHSGGHINPAITLAAALSGHLGWFTAGIYMLAQVTNTLLL